MRSHSYPRAVSRLRVFATVLVAVLACTAAAGSYAAVQDKVYVIADFTDASPLLVGNDVKTYGVKVGTVDNIALVNEVARVTMELDPQVLPLYRNATATIEPVSLLGERSVSLDSGTPDAPEMRPGEVIPTSQTGSVTDLQEILNTFDDPTGEALAMLVGGLGVGLRGNGADTDAALKALAPALTKTDQFVSVLQEQNAVLNSLVENVEPVARSLAVDNGKRLDSLISSTTSILGTTSANQAALDATLRELPSTLAAAQSTLAELAGTARATEPLLADVRPTTDNLEEISNELLEFTDAANPALDALVPVLEEGRVLLEEAQPVAEELRDAAPQGTKLTTGLSPVINELSANIGNVLEFVRGFALLTNGKDGLGHYLRAFVIPNVASGSGNLPGSVGNGGPNPREKSGQPPPTLPVPSMLAPQPAPDGGQTGLSQEQESDALGFLLGGDK